MLTMAEWVLPFWQRWPLLSDTSPQFWHLAPKGGKSTSIAKAVTGNGFRSALPVGPVLAYRAATALSMRSDWQPRSVSARRAIRPGERPREPTTARTVLSYLDWEKSDPWQSR